MNDKDWVQMKFDPEQLVNVRSLISVMRGEVATLSKDQWEDTKECCADVMEQFLELRRDAEKLDRNLRSYVIMHNDLEKKLIRTNGMEAYRAFKAKQRAGKEKQGE
jgi:hypothetical protein